MTCTNQPIPVSGGLVVGNPSQRTSIINYCIEVVSKTYSAVFCWRILSYLFGLVCAVHSSSAPLYHCYISVIWRCRPGLVCTIHSHRYRCWYVLSDQERNWSLVLSLWGYAQICMKCMLKRDVYLKCSEVKYVCAAADHIALISSLHCLCPNQAMDLSTQDSLRLRYDEITMSRRHQRVPLWICLRRADVISLLSLVMGWKMNLISWNVTKHI